MKRLLFIPLLLLAFSGYTQTIIRANSFYVAPAVAAPSGGPPSFLGSDGHTWGWYISADEGSITKPSNLVSEWADTLDSNHDLLQGTGSKQPTWSSGGITFDATNDDVLATGAITLNQPTSLWLVVNNVTWNTDVGIFEGVAWYTYGLIEAGASTPAIRFRTAAPTDTNMCLTINAFHVLRVELLDNAGVIKIDAKGATSSDPGAGNLGGFTIPQLYQGNDIIYKEIIIRNQVDAAGDITLIYNYLKNRYGL